MTIITITGVKMILCAMLLIIRADIIIAGIVLVGMYDRNSLYNIVSIAIILEFFGLIFLMSVTFLGQAIEQGRKFRILTLVLNVITALPILVSEILIYRYVELTPFEICGKVVSISVFLFLMVELFLSKNEHTVNNAEDAEPDVDVRNLVVNHNEDEYASCDEEYTEEHNRVYRLNATI